MKHLSLIFLCFFCVGCAVNKQILNQKASELAGFSADGSFVLSDPPKDRARIYFYRDNSSIGAYLGFSIRIIYEPRLKNGTPKYDDYVDSLGYLASGRTFFADIYAGRQVAIMAKTMAMSFIVFTPQKGKIYCIKADMKNGALMPSPNITLVSKNVCEDAWIDYFKAENLDFQNQWRKVYNERGDRILSEPPFVDEPPNNETLDKTKESNINFAIDISKENNDKDSKVIKKIPKKKSKDSKKDSKSE